jgi:hypothetical protein
MNSPIISFDLESDPIAIFQLKIVRDSRDRASKTQSRPSTICALISWTRPSSVPDRKSSRKKEGGMFQQFWMHERSGRRRAGQNRPFQALITIPGETSQLSRNSFGNVAFFGRLSEPELRPDQHVSGIINARRDMFQEK